MKKLLIYKVGYLRMYPVAKERTSAVNGVKSLKVAAIVLTDFLPFAADQKQNNVIEVTTKELDNLCQIAGLRGTGEETWFDFQRFIGNATAAKYATATISSEEHTKGDTYVDGDGKEQEYTKTSVMSRCDSIALPDSVSEKLCAKSIDRQVNWADANAALRAMFGAKATPVLETN